MADLGYDGKVAVITGAGGGLGRQHALVLAERGARVVINDLGGSVSGEGGDEGPAEATAKEIESKGGIAVSNTDSVATAEGGEAIIQTALDAFGQVDIVINNAGILRDKTFHNMTPEFVDPVIDVHLRGAFHVTIPAWKHHARSGLRTCREHRVERRACSATSGRPTTARRRWVWSGSRTSSPSRARSTTSTPTRSARSPRRA
ncbi:MAG: SDR family NAD(P)-dependent oxidoreductase [Acidimicrobiia bacterium]|nr:SDR family NAD(P)-dependent oxidoreductase [Acidimicrobiia bacterium]